MNMRRTFPTSASWVIVAAILGLVGSGCEKRSPEERAARRAMRAATKPALQAHLNALRSIPVERNPDSRPLTISKPSPSPRDWALGALREGYLQTGFTNGQWDAPAMAAFEAYCDLSRNLQDERLGAITNAVARARAAGCKDPMLQYFYARYSPGDHNDTDEKYAIELVKACGSLITSKHHPAFQHIAAFRAISAARRADSNGDRAALQLLVNNALVDFARDSNAPPAEVFQAAEDWLPYTRARGWTDFVMGDLNGILEAHWPNDPRLFGLRGAADVQRAWEARGGSWANTVSDEGWAGFAEHLKNAEGQLTKSWELAPTNAAVAYHLMQVELGQGRGRPVMERWFDRAMALSTNYYDAVQLMSFYLEPRWYGSQEASLEFARDCVANKAWGGQVPLVLPHVHHSLAKYFKKEESPAYWQRSEVWEDIRSAYDRFFALNPSETSWRHDYARDAFLCGQYEAFLAQTKLFDTGTNHAFFGGQARFDQMLRTASAAVSKSARQPAPAAP